MLREHTQSFMRTYTVTRYLKGVLTKILHCRTALLRGRVYECPECRSRCHVYNSCGDRHCPQCTGARRADWLAQTARLLLPKVPYFHLVFTVPHRLSAVMLGNRRPLYDLLFRSAWEALDEVLRETGQFQPAAAMVLHTWNQELDHHPHIHAVVPGGGPSLDGQRWVTTRHPTQRNREKPYLVDNVLLGRRFREKFAAGFRRLALAGQLRLEKQWSALREPVRLDEWLAQVTESDWNVFIEGPPHGKSDPRQVLKYLARYLTGGPISDSRIVSDENGQVTFSARSRSKSSGSGRRQVIMSGRQFVRRWAMHILPKGYTRTRCYGGYHGRKRGVYLALCRALLNPKSEPTAPTAAAAVVESEQPVERVEATPPTCPRCDVPMCCIARYRRPSWREFFTRRIYDDACLYAPVLQDQRGPPAYPHLHEPDPDP